MGKIKENVNKLLGRLLVLLLCVGSISAAEGDLQGNEGDLAVAALVPGVQGAGVSTKRGTWQKPVQGVAPASVATEDDLEGEEEEEGPGDEVDPLGGSRVGVKDEEKQHDFVGGASGGEGHGEVGGIGPKERVAKLVGREDEANMRPGSQSQSVMSVQDKGLRKDKEEELRSAGSVSFGQVVTASLSAGVGYLAAAFAHECGGLSGLTGVLGTAGMPILFKATGVVNLNKTQKAAALGALVGAGVYTSVKVAPSLSRSSLSNFSLVTVGFSKNQVVD